MRYLFAQAAVEYEDVRIEEEKWKEMKPSMPFEALPVLEVDGKQIGSSMIIGRYLGEKFGLAGENDLENAEIASIVDIVHDMNIEIFKYWFGPQAKSEELLQKLKKETVPAKLKLFEKRAASNESGWQFGGKLTWADFGVYISMELVCMIFGDDYLQDYPGLTKLRSSVEALPRIAEWIKNRPITQF